MSTENPWQDDTFARRNIEHLDSKFLPGTAQEVDFLECKLGLKAGMAIADLGCGLGRHSIEFARRGYRVTAVDISPALVEEARRRAGSVGVRVAFHVSDMGSIGPDLLPAGCFDAALCLCESGLGVLGGEGKDLEFLKTVRLSLRPGGSLVITNFNGIRKYRQFAIGMSFDYVRGVTRWMVPAEFAGCEHQQDLRQYTPSELSMLLRLAGFESVEICGCKPGDFCGQPLQVDDIEMMAIARAGRDTSST
jgi:2-polyprenyl-3-methyl-5-hydroxy-6-metoxy-1,4-benzoquinol methylase